MSKGLTWVAEDEDDDTDLRAAVSAGWRKCDVKWERLQEEANSAWFNGEAKSAVRKFQQARRLAFWRMRRSDPRYATSLANAGFAARILGHERTASKNYADARALWANVPATIDHMLIRPRARSSLFHLRMEARHWQTYQGNIRKRIGRFVEEAGEALEAIEQGKASPHRLYHRWRGECPVIYDDTRKYMSAALLICGAPPDKVSNESI